MTDPNDPKNLDDDLEREIQEALGESSLLGVGSSPSPGRSTWMEPSR